MFFFFFNGYSVQNKTLVSNIYRCLFVYFKHRFRYRKICLLLLSHQKIKGVILLFKSNLVIILNYFMDCFQNFADASVIQTGVLNYHIC